MSAAAAGAAAAAAARRRRLEEELRLATYTPNDLADGWEFKILRSATGAFRSPDRLREALEQEGRAGWVLLEKFDNQRIRLKRPAGARTNDASLGFDAYRTSYGTSELALALTIITSVVSVLVIVALVAAYANRP
jgi:hypothetical protein